MTLVLLRTRFSAFAAKIESTPGTDSIAGTPATGDWIAGTIATDYGGQIIPNPEQTGSLDGSAGISGGLRSRVRMNVPLRGSGTAGTAPSWATLMRCCTMGQTDTAAAVGAPTAAASGTTTTVTAASPFGTTAQQYRGMVLQITGTAAETTTITDYTTGRVATLSTTLSTAATTGSLLAIPVNNLFYPTSDESVYKTATIYAFTDGVRWTMTGFVGSWSLNLTTGSFGELVFDGMAQVSAAPSNVAVPTGWNTAVRLTPPTWIAGRSNLNRAIARASRLNFGANVGVVLPDNPEAAEGYDPGVPISRAMGGSIDPLIQTDTHVALYAAFRAGTPMPLMAIIGSTAGNRFALTTPQARVVEMNPGDRGGLMQHGVAFQCEGADATGFLCAF